MTLTMTVGPAAEPVTLAEAKAHLRLAADSEDDLLGGLIRSAREWVERATGLALIDQFWRLTLDRLPEETAVPIRRHPVREIVAVTGYGPGDEARLIGPAEYDADLASRPARIRFRRRQGPLREMNGVEIDFRAGYGEAGTDVPDLLRRAIVLLVAHWFEFRTASDDRAAPLPKSVERLVSGYRSGRL